jgi:hypothetical protein
MDLIYLSSSSETTLKAHLYNCTRMALFIYVAYPIRRQAWVRYAHLDCWTACLSRFPFLVLAHLAHHLAHHAISRSINCFHSCATTLLRTISCCSVRPCARGNNTSGNLVPGNIDRWTSPIGIRRLILNLALLRHPRRLTYIWSYLHTRHSMPWTCLVYRRHPKRHSKHTIGLHFFNVAIPKRQDAAHPAPLI